MPFVFPEQQLNTQSCFAQLLELLLSDPDNLHFGFEIDLAYKLFCCGCVVCRRYCRHLQFYRLALENRGCGWNLPFFRNSQSKQSVY